MTDEKKATDSVRTEKTSGADEVSLAGTSSGGEASAPHTTPDRGPEEAGTCLAAWEKKMAEDSKRVREILDEARAEQRPPEARLVRCWRCKHDVPEETTVCNAGIGTQCKDAKACRGRWYYGPAQSPEVVTPHGVRVHPVIGSPNLRQVPPPTFPGECPETPGNACDFCCLNCMRELPDQRTDNPETIEDHPWGPGCSHDPDCASEIEHRLAIEGSAEPVQPLYGPTVAEPCPFDRGDSVRLPDGAEGVVNSVSVRVHVQRRDGTIGHHAPSELRSTETRAVGLDGLPLALHPPVRRVRVTVEIETMEDDETARDWVEEAVGDAFACDPEELHVTLAPCSANPGISVVEAAQAVVDGARAGEPMCRVSADLVYALRAALSTERRKVGALPGPFERLVRAAQRVVADAPEPDDKLDELTRALVALGPETNAEPVHGPTGEDLARLADPYRRDAETLYALFDKSFTGNAARVDAIARLVAMHVLKDREKRPETALVEGDDWPPLRVTQATAQARSEGRAEERAAVLAYLEKEIAEAGYVPRASALKYAHDEIARGEHLALDEKGEAGR